MALTGSAVVTDSGAARLDALLTNSMTGAHTGAARWDSRLAWSAYLDGVRSVQREIGGVLDLLFNNIEIRLVGLISGN